MEDQIDNFSNDKIDQLVLNSKYPHNSLSLIIPYDYVKKNISVKWNDLLFLIKNGYLDKTSAIEYAIDCLSETDDERVIRLACSDEYDTVENYFMKYIEELANEEPSRQKKCAKDKVMFVLLSWLYDSRTLIEDPIRILDVVFDDFDFPLLLQDVLDSLHDMGRDYCSNEIYIMWYRLIKQIQDRIS